MSRLQAFIKRLWKQQEVVLLCVAGLLTLGVIDNMLVQGFQRDQQYRETLMAQRIEAQIKSAIEEHVTALIALKVVYQNFVDISHYDFQQYGKSITSTLHGFRRLYYIDPSMTIRQVYPLSPESKGLLEYSLAREPKVSSILSKAQKSPDPTTSTMVPFMNDATNLWAVIPIFRNNKEFLGYAAGEVSINRIWKTYAQSEQLKKYQVQLIDPDGTPTFEGVRMNENDPNLTQVPFRVGGKSWTLMLKPINPPFESLFLQRVGLWGAGLMIFYLLSLLIQAGKRHKSVMEEAQKQFETIFEASPDGIIMMDDKLNLQITNPMVREWTGQSEAELTSRKFFDLFECQCPNLNKCSELGFLLCTSKQFSGDLPEILETRILNPPDGSPRSLRLNATQIDQDHTGQPQKGFICVLGDISTSKELERVKETYVATLTHDLKTPLLAQQMVLDRLLSGSTGKVNEDQKKLLSGAHESVQDLLDMVNATLLFYKLESSHVSLHKHRLPVPPMVKDVMETLQPLAEKRGVKLELDSSVDLPEAWIDPVQMKRVFHNLLSNAISYAKKDSPIRVSIQTDIAEHTAEDGSPRKLLIEVSNEGKGISAEDLPRIFDKYYSLSRKFKQIGTGLGLYIARRIVELHGGKIWVESEPDKMTRFYISLPCPQQVESTVDVTLASTH